MENYSAYSNSRRGGCTKFEHRHWPGALRQTSWPGRVSKQHQQLQQHHISGPRILRQRRANSYSSDPLNLRWVAQESLRRELAGESPMPGDSALNSPVLADASSSSGLSVAEATAAASTAATVEAAAAEVATVAPAPASWRQRRSSAEASAAAVGASGSGGQFNRQRSLSFKRPPPHRFVPVYGNYRASRRGGLNIDRMQDDRLQLLQPDWYTDKEVLDIGCNDGVFSLKIAEALKVRAHRGGHRRPAAQANLRRKLTEAEEEAQLRRQLASEGFPSVADEQTSASSVASSSASGVANSSASVSTTAGGFPHNVSFVTGNYVLENESQLASIEENKYDIIQAFSITKWIHLNWGDRGLKLFFKRAFRELRPDGKFIVEPQPYQTYRRHLLCPEHRRNYACNIELRPERFRAYLEQEVGFAHILAISEQQQCHGFQRPLLMCSKPTGCTPAPPLSLGPLGQMQQHQLLQLQRADSADRLFMDHMAAASSTTVDTPRSIRLPEEVVSPLWEVDEETEDNNNNNNADGIRVVESAELPVQAEPATVAPGRRPMALDRSTPVRACTAGGRELNRRDTSLVVRSSPSTTISSMRASGAATSAATFGRASRVSSSTAASPFNGGGFGSTAHPDGLSLSLGHLDLAVAIPGRDSLHLEGLGLGGTAHDGVQLLLVAANPLPLLGRLQIISQFSLRLGPIHFNIKVGLLYLERTSMRERWHWDSTMPASRSDSAEPIAASRFTMAVCVRPRLFRVPSIARRWPSIVCNMVSSMLRRDLPRNCSHA
uniref:RNA methyltransferase n=1 Tax=Macrostomum lignano TaxID=282301 RepID=A0A1I8ILB2_9PLAT